MNAIDKIIIHCAATPDDDSSTIDIHDIRRWHVDDNGWSDVGYHVVIPRTGQIQYGRPLDQSGAHARGSNDGSIGVCVVGSRRFNDAQLSSLVKVVTGFQKIHDIQAENILGHRELQGVSKDCPGFDVGLIRAFLI